MATLTVLGIAQDGGRPQPGCLRPCCQNLTQADYRSPVSLGIKTENGTTILIEATRDLGRQLKIFGESTVDRLFLTHAHLGHVDGHDLAGVGSREGCLPFDPKIIREMGHEDGFSTNHMFVGVCLFAKKTLIRF